MTFFLPFVLSFHQTELPSLKGNLLLEPPSILERMFVEKVLDNCPKHPRETIDPFDVLALIRLEENLSVPPEAKGILPAVFCIESGLQPDAFSLVGDQGKALGWAQWHLDQAKDCMGDVSVNGIDWRSDFYFSARCWIQRIQKLLPRAEKKCGKTVAWKVAEASVSNIAKYQWRCDSRDPQWSSSAHWRLKRFWNDLE